MSSQEALKDVIRAKQAAMSGLIAQQKQAAINERDELIAVDARQQERLVKRNRNPSRHFPEPRRRHSISLRLSQARKAQQRLRNILMVEQLLEGLRGEYSEARAKLLYNLLSSWKTDPIPEIVAAVKELPEVLDSTHG